MEFSICLIAKNEEKTLPRLFNTLKEFKNRGGEICLLDTGSTDKTVKVAEDFGCKVESVGDKFRIVIDKDLVDKINKHFLVDEPDVLKEGDTLFDFASARNHASKMASNDMIATPDCDEVYTKFDIDKLNEVIKSGAEQLEYNFVFSHDQYGNEAIKFRHCKFYNRKKLEWKNIVHEVLTGNAQRTFLDEDIIKLEHWQNEEQNRGGYLRGLALDCYNNPDNDRNSHYFARELLWNNRPKSAIKEFKRHIKMNQWLAERAQSMIFIGDAYGQLSKPDEQVSWYNKAFYLDGSRREALLKLAHFYKHNNEPQKVACYVAAAMEIPWAPFYANFKTHYTNEPHELMYWAKGWLGQIEDAKYHLKKALEYQPLNTQYLHDIRYYFKLPKVSIVIPQLGREEKLKRLAKLIDENANYPDYEVIIERDSFEDTQGVPKIVKKAVAKSKGELVMYLGNDCIPQPNFLILAVWKMLNDCPDGLVGLNDMYWHGEFFTHWLASKKLLPYLDGEFFHTGYHHNGCDNELTERCKKIGKAVWCEEAKVLHDHPIREDFKGEVDKVHKIARKFYKEDRELLKKRSEEIGFDLRENFIHPDIKLSAVVAFKNKVEMTYRAIESLIQNTKSLGEVIVIDDNSTEDIKPYIEKLGKYNIPIVYKLNEKGGVNAAWSLGASLAKFPYVVIFNNDILFSPNWDKPLIDVLDDNTWLVSPYHTYGDLPKDFPVGKERHKNMEGHDVGLPFIGSCFMMKKENLDKIMPIDERLNIWCGDNFIYEMIKVDFGREAKEIKQSYIHHFGKKTVNEISGDIVEKEKETFEKIYNERNWTDRKEYCSMIPDIDLRLKLPIKDLHKMKVLNVGMGSGESGLARQLPLLNFKQLDNIDTHQPYLDKAKNSDWTCKNVNFINADIRDYDFSDYDFVMIFDVLEHLEKEDSLKIINKFKKVFIFIPIEKDFRDNPDGVEEQEHKSLWTERDFKEFNTTILPDFHLNSKGNRFDALWAIK